METEDFYQMSLDKECEDYLMYHPELPTSPSRPESEEIDWMKEGDSEMGFFGKPSRPEPLTKEEETGEWSKADLHKKLQTALDRNISLAIENERLKLKQSQPLSQPKEGEAYWKYEIEKLQLIVGGLRKENADLKSQLSGVVEAWIEMGELCQMPESGQFVLWYDSKHDYYETLEYRGMGVAHFKSQYTHWIPFNKIPKPVTEKNK